MRKKQFLSKLLALASSVLMLSSSLSIGVNAEIPTPLPPGVNAGYSITDEASFLAARDNAYLIGGAIEYTTLATEPENEVLKLTANTASTERYQWDLALFTNEPLTVGGTYEISYKIMVPDEAGKGEVSAQIMREDKWGYEVPASPVVLTKDTWTEVTGELVVEGTEFSEIRFLLNYDVQDLPTQWYMDDIEITLVDYTTPEPEVVGAPNEGVHITFDEATDRAKIANEYVADSGSVEWVSGAGVGYNNDGHALKATYNSNGFNQSWKGAYNLFLTDPISVNGTYKISYQVYVPTAGNEDKEDIRAGFVVDNGFGNGYGVTEFPVPDATVTKDEWIEVSATLPKTAKAVNWFALRFTGNAGNFPNVYYVDEFKIELVDFDTTPPVVPGWEEDTASFKDTFEGIFKVGNILQAAAFTNAESEETKKEFLKQYNAITLENAMKPDQLSNAKGSYDFTDADAIVDWAVENGLDVHGHVFVWHSQSPKWLNEGLTRAQAKENMEEYIQTVAEHFNGRVGTWDVVNEAFYNDAQDIEGNDVVDWRDGLRSVDLPGDAGSLWYQAYANGMDVAAGEDPSDFIYDAFVFARQYAPDVKLFYNDFNDDIPNKVNAICNMINDINGKWANDSRNEEPERLLIEGMGLQSHYSTTWTNDTENVRNALNAYIATGVEIDISELDVSIENEDNELNTVENQRRIYNELFEIYTSPGIVEHISRVTFWGMHDGVSWRGAKRCLPFDLNQKAKPVFEDIISIGEAFAFPPGNVNPDGTNPDGTNPGGVSPDGTNPGGVNPDGTNPGGVNPDGTNPGGVSPDGTNPGGVSPDGTNPGGAVQGGAGQDGAANNGGTTGTDDLNKQGKKGAPKTGDEQSSIVYIGGIASCLAVAAYVIARKKG